MAEFCNKCAEEMGFPEPDINVYEIWESLQPGYYEGGHICEGCGFLGIARGTNDEIFVIHDVGNNEVDFLDYENYSGLKPDNNE
jgi:hypothetical protein